MKILAFLSFMLVMVMPSVAVAQGAHCQDVDSTAASQECLKRYLRSEQARLNKIYNKLSNSLSPERLEELKKLQKVWLTYRDSECMWEAEKPEESVLKRVNELSCMARVTEDRADLLTVAYDDDIDPATKRKFGTFPRWMNALAKDYPGIYWQYGSRIRRDANCDGVDEYIMTGIKKEESYPETHVAIVQNPAIGKPESTLFTVPATLEGEGDDEEVSCAGDVKVTVKGGKAMEERAQEGEMPACEAEIVLSPKKCPAQIVKWTGKAFAVVVEERADEETKKK